MYTQRVHASNLRARTVSDEAVPNRAAVRFADSALELSRALCLGQWGYPSQEALGSGAAVSTGRCLAAILCVAETGLLCV